MLRRSFLLAPAAAPRLVDVQRIWDAAPHNAFTDLVKHRGRWFCCFREASTHVSADGKLRVLASKDLKQWESAALLTSNEGDLRDPKITIDPRGRLMMTSAVALPPGGAVRHRSLVWTSNDGRAWSGQRTIGDDNYWLWRVTWHKGMGYSIGYQTNVPREQIAIRLYRTADGQRFETHVADLGVKEYPNESAIRFAKDGTAWCLLRRDPGHALLGRAKSPYTEWTWRDLGMRFGGPNMIQVPDGRWIAGGRIHQEKTTRTAICVVDPEQATMRPILELPSKGDSSYPGLAWEKGLLRVSYYASHEARTSIYLASVAL